MAGDGSLIIQTVIANDPWNYGNLPEAHAKLTFLEDKGFQVDMWCYETGMRAVNTEPDTPVYEDSCLECFLNFYPEESPNYMNFEVNSLGTMLCQVGINKTERTFIRDMGLEQPEVTAEVTEEGWHISYVIPFSLIRVIYGKAEFPDGHKMTGNFYKCGDLTSQVHYGCWNMIGSPEPNYHLPQYFGELTVNRSIDM